MAKDRLFRKLAHEQGMTARSVRSHISHDSRFSQKFILPCGQYHFKFVNSFSIDAFFKMSLKRILTEIHEQALSADLLLSSSGELLESVVKVGGTVANSATTLNAAVLKLHRTNNDGTADNEATRVRMRKTAIHTAKAVVQLSAQAALSIRHVIGWDDHPYRPDQRNGESTLIGIERALHQLSAEMTSLASLWVPENSFTEICQRISAVVLAAESNTRIATANVVAVEAVGAMAIKIARAN